jgi:hypothetical protein
MLGGAVEEMMLVRNISGMLVSGKDFANFAGFLVTSALRVPTAARKFHKRRLANVANAQSLVRFLLATTAAKPEAERTAAPSGHGCSCSLRVRFRHATPLTLSIS